MSADASKTNKIFGIGLSRTGTMSLDRALRILGIRSIHWPVDRKTYHDLSNGIYRLSILDHYQAITDITTSPFYPQFDKIYPGSKFILTVRDRGSWMESMKVWNEGWLESSRRGTISRHWYHLMRQVRHHGLPNSIFRGRLLRFLMDIDHRVRMIEFQRLVTYGAVAFEDVSRLMHVYDTHYKTVMDYFKDRPQDLLVMNICAGDGWDKLCPFLGVPVPEKPFPNVNKRPQS